MNRNTLRDSLYAAIAELLHDKSMYYRGITREYDVLTEKGTAALADIVNMFGREITKYETAELDKRARELVFKDLSE